MDEPAVERLNRLQAMLEMLCQEAAELKAHMERDHLRQRWADQPSEESRRPLSRVPESPKHQG